MTDFETTQTNNASATSSSLASSTDASDSESSGVSMDALIPMYVRDLCKKPKLSELRVSYDAPTFQTTYTYSITWDDTMDSENKYKSIMEQKSSKTNLQLSPKASSNLSFTGAPTPVDGICDGPCKRVFPSNLLNTIGRCGHYLCNACYGIVKNTDLTDGCSSFNCYWKGSSREETRKYYEKEVARVQRAKARDMKKRGIDVKAASSTSLVVTKSSDTSSAKTSETNCSVKSGCDQTLSMTDRAIKVKLIIVEETDEGAALHTFCEMDAISSSKMYRALAHLLEQKKQKKPEDLLRKGTLYYTELKPDKSKALRRVRKRDIKTLELSQLPEIANSIVFVLDMGGFVKKGNAIYV